MLESKVESTLVFLESTIKGKKTLLILNLLIAEGGHYADIR